MQRFTPQRVPERRLRCVERAAAIAQKTLSDRRRQFLRHHLAHQRDDLRAVKLDAAHELVVRERAGRVFQIEARRCRALSRSWRSCARPSRASRHTARRAPLPARTCRARHRRPAALGADAVVHAPCSRANIPRAPARRCQRRTRANARAIGSAGLPSCANAR